MDIRIDVGPIWLRVSPLLCVSDFKLLKKKLTYTVPNYEFTNQHINYGWDGKVSLLHKDQTAPSGCVYRVKHILERWCNHTTTIVHKNDYQPLGNELVKLHNIELMNFQTVAVANAVKYRRGIIQAPVRAGKTAIAAAIIARIGHYPVWVITFGKDLVKQTSKDLELTLQRPIGMFSESEYTPGDIVVSSYQALSRAASVGEHTAHLSAKIQQRNKQILKSINDARVVIYDECQHAMSPKNGNVLRAALSAGYVIGLSGTPIPKDSHRIEVEAAIGAILFRVRYETLIKCHRLARPMIVAYQTPYCWYATGLRDYATVYDSNIVGNIYRNRLIADVVKKLHESGKTSFVMIRKLAHGPILRALIPGSTFVHGHISSVDRATLYTALNNKDVHCVIATVGKEGLNIPSLDAVINAEGMASEVVTIQKMRSLTAFEGKKRGLVIDFLDRGKFLAKHSKRRIKLYEKHLSSVKIKIRNIPKDLYPMEGTRWQSL